MPHADWLNIIFIVVEISSQFILSLNVKVCKYCSLKNIKNKNITRKKSTKYNSHPRTNDMKPTNCNYDL